MGDNSMVPHSRCLRVMILPSMYGDGDAGQAILSTTDRSKDLDHTSESPRMRSHERCTYINDNGDLWTTKCGHLVQDQCLKMTRRSSELIVRASIRHT